MRANADRLRPDTFWLTAHRLSVLTARSLGRASHTGGGASFGASDPGRMEVGLFCASCEGSGQHGGMHAQHSGPLLRLTLTGQRGGHF